MLKAEQLRFLQFGPFDLEIAAGECLGLTGPSGAGKTRMLRSLADLDPHRGRVTLAGEDAASIAGPVWRKNVGYLPTESRWWHERVGEHFPEAPGDSSPMVSFEDLGFEEDVLDWEVQRLSTGERQRLALCRLLLNRPRVLLLDEPTSGLDADNTSRVEAVVGGYRESADISVLWVAHDLGQLERVTSRALLLSEGRLEPRP